MAKAGSRTCGNCGTVNSAIDQFCSNCGYALASGPPDKTIHSSPNIANTTGRRVTGALLTGNLLSARYRIVQLIGKGGFGAVYKATDERFQRRVVAIKEMSDAQLSAKEKAKAIQDFRNEAELLVELSHPNLPNVSDFFEEGDKAYLVMEFIEGKTLEKLQDEQGGPLDETQVMGLALQLCAVLQYLHTRARPIIFRDMKPTNVMVTAEGQIKLIDFGIARIFKSAGTKDTTLLGSQGYAPLEQYGRGQSDARSDIYALGATLYDLLTKELPADAPSRRINPQIFVNPRQINSQISQVTEDIVLKAMEQDPNDRYQSAIDMYQAIADSGIAQQSGTLLASGNTLTQMPTVQVKGNTAPTAASTVATRGPSQYNKPGQIVPPPPPSPSLNRPAQPAYPLAGSARTAAGPQPISRRALLIGGASVVGAAVVGGTVYFATHRPNGPTQTGPAGPTTGTINLNFTYSTEKQAWLQQALSDFNKKNVSVNGKTIQVQGNIQGSVDAQAGILNGNIQPVAWSPASLLEINQLNSAWKSKNGQELTFSSNDLFPKSLVSSPLVFAIWEKRAQLLQKKYATIDWPSIHDAVLLQQGWSELGDTSGTGLVKLAQTTPAKSNSGLLSITLIAYSYYKNPRNLTVAQIQDQGFLQYMKDIEDAVQLFGRSSGTYLSNEVIPKGQRSYDIIFTYENLVLTNEQAAKNDQKQILLPFYPNLNIVSDHPFAILNGKWVSDDQQKAALQLRDFLLSEEQQRKALASGFRPSNTNVKITDKVAGNPFLNQPAPINIQTDISNQAKAPNGDVINELLKQWNNLYGSAPTALSVTPDKGSQNNGSIRL